MLPLRAGLQPLHLVILQRISYHHQMGLTGNFMRHFSIAFSALMVLCLAACATSHVMLGKARPPISPDMVQIYNRPPTTHYEEIAQLSTSSQGSFSFTAQGKTDAVIGRLKVEAAKLGANGVILQGIGDQPSGSVGTGGGTESYSGGGAVGGGIGVNLQTTRKVGGGLAIFVAAP